MKKTTFLKTLLMAVGLCMGTSAWGQVTTTLLEYGTNDVPWTGENISAFDFTYSDVFHASVYTHTYALDGSYAKVTTNRCGYAQATATISPTANATLNIEAEFLLNCSTGKYFSNGTASFFRFGNIWIVENDQDKKSNYLLSGSFTGSSVGTNFHSETGYRSTGINYRLVAEINTATNTLVTLNVYVNGSASASLSLSDVALSSPNYTTVEFGLVNDGHQTNNPVEGLKSIKITQTTSATEYADYTVHFVDNNGATVKADEVRSGEVGSTVNANSADQETFYSGGYKYVYANDGDGVEVVKAGTSEMTVTYTKYGQYTYNVYAVNSSDAKLQNDPIATATTYEGESATPKWSKYIKIGGTWYVSSESTFSATATEAGSKNVIYTPADGIDYFFEFENLAKTGSFAATEDGVELSNKNAARFSKSSKVWTSAIAAGTYTLNIYCKGTNAKSPTLPMYYCDTDGSNLVYIGEATACRANYWELKEKTGVVIPEGKALCLYNTDDKNNSNYLVDYFTLTRTGDATVSKTITSAGWATYCSPYALDFSSAIANLSAAYLVVGGAGGYVTKSQITTTIPANTGILLRGEGEVTIPVVASSSTDVLANKLVGVTANTDIAANAGYVLMNDATYGVGFYQNVNAFTVGANTAYLPAGFDGGSIGTARSFFGLWNDGETTSISDASRLMDNGYMRNDNFFNLNGQRVEKPAKGLYIVNGKKVVMK